MSVDLMIEHHRLHGDINEVVTFHNIIVKSITYNGNNEITIEYDHTINEYNCKVNESDIDVFEWFIFSNGKPYLVGNIKEGIVIDGKTYLAKDYTPKTYYDLLRYLLNDDIVRYTMEHLVY